MHISFFQAFLIGVVYYLGNIGTPWLSLLGSISVVYKPLVAGTLVGCILGDPVQGCIIGAAINLPYVAFISAGGTAPADPGLAGTVGTAWAMAAGIEPAAAVTIALPLGLLGTAIWVAHMTLDIPFVHVCDKAAEEGNLEKICFWHVVPPQILMFALCVIPATVATYFGADDVTDLVGTDELETRMNDLVAINGLTVEASKDANGNDVAFLYKWDGSGSQGDDLYFNVSLNGETYTFTVNAYMIGTGSDSEVYKAIEALNIGDVINVEGFLYWYNAAQPHITSVTVAG